MLHVVAPGLCRCYAESRVTDFRRFEGICSDLIFKCQGVLEDSIFYLYDGFIN